MWGSIIGGVGSFVKDLFDKDKKRSDVDEMVLAMMKGGAGTLGHMGAEYLGDKIRGIPTPMSPGDMGTAASKFYDKAFPGTTPSERLGAGSPAGQIAMAQFNQKFEERMQKRALASQKAIAAAQNAAHVTAAAIPYGGDAVDQGRDALGGRRIGTMAKLEVPYQTMSMMAAEKLEVELATLEQDLKNKAVDYAVKIAEMKIKGTQSEVEKLKLEFERDMLKEGLKGKQIDNILRPVESVGKLIGGAIMAKKFRGVNVYKNYHYGSDPRAAMAAGGKYKLVRKKD